MLNCGGKIDQNVSADDHLRQDVCMGMLSRRQRKRWDVASDLMEKSLHQWNQVVSSVFQPSTGDSPHPSSYSVSELKEFKY